MNPEKPKPKNDQIKVPRDARLDHGEGPTMPSPSGARMKDEDYAVQDQPVLPGSPAARQLQAHPPKGKEQLREGTAGDAGRPSKEGIHNKPVPPRGHL